MLTIEQKVRIPESVSSKELNTRVQPLMSDRVRLPSISFIVARSFPGNAIGYKNRLPWHLKSDLKRFRQITTGNVVIMGRATFESIGRPLPDRTNIVISRQPQLNNSDSVNFDKGTQLYWTNTLEDALFTADILSICRQSKDIFVIGGQTMYALFNDIVNKIYLTQVFADVPGDAFFRASFPSKQWKLLEEIDHSKNYDGDDYSYRFSIYERRERRFRYAFVSKYFTDKSEKEEWLQLQIKTHRKLITQYIQENLDV